MDRNRLSVSSDSLFKELAFNSCKTLDCKLNKIYCQYYLLSAALLFADSIFLIPDSICFLISGNILWIV